MEAKVIEAGNKKLCKICGFPISKINDSEIKNVCFDCYLLFYCDEYGRKKD